MIKQTPQRYQKARQQLEAMGENIRLARLRRQLPTEILADRAGISRTTLRKIERGSAKVGIGCYANVLHTLSLSKDLGVVAKDDNLGRSLQDKAMTYRIRVPKRSKQE